MSGYDKARADRYHHGSRMLRERGWEGVGDEPGAWELRGGTELQRLLSPGPATFEGAVLEAGLERRIREAITAERRAATARAFVRMRGAVSLSMDNLKIRVAPTVRRMREIAEREAL